jgi:homoserine O-acetyltransferase/O-succinyltransferase
MQRSRPTAFEHLHACTPAGVSRSRSTSKSCGGSWASARSTIFWEKRFLRRDANNLLAMLRTWQHNDVGATPGFDGSLERALGAVRAKALVMAAQTDLYFTPEDIGYEAALITRARFEVIPSVWGHQAGNGLNPTDTRFIDERLKALLAA